MTDFGLDKITCDSKESKQDDANTKLDTLHTDLGKLHKQTTHTFVDAVVFNSTDEAYTSAAFAVSDYREFSLLTDLAVANAPTDIVIRVQFSDDNVTYYNLMNGPFGDLRYEDTAGDKLEAVFGKVMAAYMKVYVLSSGCDATNTFTLTVKAVLGK